MCAFSNIFFKHIVDIFLNKKDNLGQDNWLGCLFLIIENMASGDVISDAGRSRSEVIRFNLKFKCAYQ